MYDTYLRISWDFLTEFSAKSHRSTKSMFLFSRMLLGVACLALSWYCFWKLMPDVFLFILIGRLYVADKVAGAYNI